MGIALQRTGRTLYVKEVADFGTALATKEGKFFAYPHALGVCCFIDLDLSAVINRIEKWEEGDVVVTNHPYQTDGMATHLPDIILIKPFFADGEIVCFGWVFAHVADMGGRVPSSISPTSTELFQEGLLIPPVKLFKRGQIVSEVVDFIKANCRTPSDNMGDLDALLAALNVGEARVASIVQKFGCDRFLRAQHDVMEHSRQKARKVFEKIPEGEEYVFWDYMDEDSVTSVPVRIKASLMRRGEKLHIDFTGTDPQTGAPFNIPTSGKRHPWITLKLAALIYTNDPDVLLNSGMFADVELTLPEGTLVNPIFPAPVGIRHASAARVYETINGALAKAMPDEMASSNGGVLVPVVLAEAGDSGEDRKVLVIQPMVGGMGARVGADGADGRDCSIANLSNNPLESVEADAAVRILAYELRQDSGGAGRWRGGAGLRLKFEVLKDGGMILGRGMDRFQFAPWGLAGGGPGAKARTVLNEGRPSERDLGRIDVLDVNAGDTVTIATPGGGGYGDPLEREVSAVVADVQLGLVSVEQAASRLWRCS